MSELVTLHGDPFAAADRTLALRSDVDDAAIEWALAERELATATAAWKSFDKHMIAVAAQGDAAIVRDTAEKSRAAGAYLDACKREHEALERYKRAARALVEALEGKTT